MNALDLPIVDPMMVREFVPTGGMEWFGGVLRFPDRRSYRTGICEPPQEICEWPIGRPIASITFGDWPEGRKNPDWNAKVYKINDAVEFP